MTSEDQITPSHYEDIFPVSCFELIKARMKACYGDEWPKYYEGFLIGNEFKYKDRAGFKGDAETDIKKALNYNKLRKEFTTCSDEEKNK